MVSIDDQERSGSGWLRLVPVSVLVVLAILTFLVWQQQIRHQRSLELRHAEDVCVQASRRLEIFVDSHLGMARVFATRWSTHETRDFSRKRFEEFASILVGELPGYHSISLLSPDLNAVWTVPAGSGGMRPDPDPELKGLLAAARRQDQMVLSAPFSDPGGHQGFYATLPLKRGPEFLGYLVIEFQAETLINECFHQRIRSEFSFWVDDSGRPLFSHGSGRTGQSLNIRAVRASRDFPVLNRTWRLTVVPMSDSDSGSGWAASLPVPLFGLMLSVGLATLVHLLLRRIELYRRARDRALREIQARETAQRALTAFETRYRSVFDSATDGFLILDQEDRIVEANPAACAMHGYPPGGMVNLSIQDLFAPSHRHLYGEFSRQLAHNGTTRLEALDARLDGSTLEVEVRGTGLHFGGKPRVLAILTDVSERRRAEQRHALLSRKVLVAQEEERARVSRELHDELGQLLTALRLELGWLQKSRLAGVAADAVVNSVELVEKAADELRRICRGLRPPLLDDLGLDPAVRNLAEEFEERTGIKADLDIQLEVSPDVQTEETVAPVPPEAALCTYRILQESLTNVSRHSKARAARISLVREPGEIVLTVSDDGTGFDAEGPCGQEGSGLAGMRERANLVNASLDVRSAPGQGTTIVLRLPVGAAEQRETP